MHRSTMAGAIVMLLVTCAMGLLIARGVRQGSWQREIFVAIVSVIIAFIICFDALFGMKHS